MKSVYKGENIIYMYIKILFEIIESLKLLKEREEMKI